MQIKIPPKLSIGKTIEMQVFEAWWLAQAYERASDAPLKAQRFIRNCFQRFPGIKRLKEDADRLNLGPAALEKARGDPRYAMDFKREVEISE